MRPTISGCTKSTLGLQGLPLPKNSPQNIFPFSDLSIVFLGRKKMFSFCPLKRFCFCFCSIALTHVLSKDLKRIIFEDKNIWAKYFNCNYKYNYPFLYLLFILVKILIWWALNSLICIIIRRNIEIVIDFAEFIRRHFVLPSEWLIGFDFCDFLQFLQSF